MQKLKMVLIAGVLVAITVLSVAGLCFSDDVQPTPDATTTDGAVMSNVSSTAPAPLEPQSVPPAE